MPTVDDKKIIFSMVGVSKTYPGSNKTILKDIYLSFFYGAKIGIIGLNGAGKSTLMKIIAGLDKSYQGNVVFSPGYSVGYLPQDGIHISWMSAAGTSTRTVTASRPSGSIRLTTRPPAAGADRRMSSAPKSSPARH